MTTIDPDVATPPAPADTDTQAPVTPAPAEPAVRIDGGDLAGRLMRSARWQQ